MPIKPLLLIISLVFSAPAFADSEPVIFKHSQELTFDIAYDALYKELEKNRFYVAFEPNMGKFMQKFAEKWADNYNKNQLESVRSLVFCNIWWTNELANADPQSLALCPLSITLVHKQGISTAYFRRPSVGMENSPAYAGLQKIENEIMQIIKTALVAPK